MPIVTQYFDPTYEVDNFKGSYTLIRSCDMSSEMKSDSLDIVASACEEYPSNNEMAAKFIKTAFDKKFGKTWHAIVGDGYGFEVTYEIGHLLYLYENGERAILVWKNS